MNKITLQCPSCPTPQTTTESYLKTYGEAALICGCGEKMVVLPPPESPLENENIQHC